MLDIEQTPVLPPPPARAASIAEPGDNQLQAQSVKETEAWLAQTPTPIVSKIVLASGAVKGRLKTCPNKAAGNDKGDPSIFFNTDGSRFFKCLHAGCANFHLADLERVYGPMTSDPWDALCRSNPLTDLSRPTEPAPQPKLSVKLLTCKQLDTERYSIRYHIPGTLAALQNHIIGGRQKTLKTTIAVDAAISLASGLPFLGSLPVSKACRVLMFSAESSLSVLQETARRICRSKGACLPDIEGLFWSEWLPRLDNAKHLAMLKQTIQETGAEVLFLDPCYLAMPGADAGNLFMQGERLRGIAEMCQEHAVCPVLLHHLRKRAKGDHSFDPPELDELSWAGFSEYARQWWLLGRREPYEGGSGSHRLWLNIGGSAGHSALWALNIEEGAAGQPRRWDVSFFRPEEARAARKENTIRQRILDAAREFPMGETKSALLGVAKIKSDPAVRAVFDSLVNEQLLVPCKIRKGAAGYDGFRLSEKGGTVCTS